MKLKIFITLLIGLMAFSASPARAGGDDPPPPPSGSCNPDSESIPTPAFHTDLAYRWAPFFIQDTANKWNADMLGKINFDGNFRSNDNWENLPGAGIAPYIYFNVVDTSTHWFVFYHTFHPRDWNNAFFGTCGPDPDCHENDTENLVLVIGKDGSAYGQFRAMITKAHHEFYQYALAGSGISGGADDLDNDPERGFVLFTDSAVGITDPRPAVYIESKGHAICDWYDNNGPVACVHPDDKVGTGDNDGIYYYPNRNVTPSVPPNPKGGQWYNHKRAYNLVSLWDDLWVLRSCTGNGNTYDPTFTYPGVAGNGSSGIGASMDGDTYGDDGATTWWAQSDTSGGQSFESGEWGFDPAATMQQMLTFPDSWSTSYTYNPYFGIQ